MYKLLIIDDDEMIRDGIKNAIPWPQYGISENRTAQNGEEGEEVFNSFMPDIVLTDIRMPGMDGLELLQVIKKKKVDTKVIILSGFDDFSYAQTALKLGAFDYLLKTADIDELLGVVNKAIEEINKERKENAENIRLRQQLSISLPLLKYRYLNDLIIGDTDTDSLIKKMNFVDVGFASDCFFVAVAEIDDFALLSEKISEEERLFSKFRVINTMEELSGKSGVCFETKYEEFVFVFFCEDSKSVEENKKNFVLKCEEICDRLRVGTNSSVSSIGLSKIGYGVPSIKFCYEDAKKALKHKLFSGQGSIVDIKDIESYTTESFKLDTETENKLISSLRVGEKNSVLKMIENLFEQMRRKRNLEIGNFHQVCIELFSLASRVLCEFDIGIDEIFGKEFLYFEEVKKHKNIEIAKGWMLLNFDKLVNYILKTKILKAKKIIEKAKLYIDEHYNEALTLNIIAEKVYLSPNYFSSVFSSAVGQSFLEYLTARRIEKAKQLLGEKDSKAFEVGESVGYDNPHYFSRIFKKYTGMSPIEYKENLKITR